MTDTLTENLKKEEIKLGIEFECEAKEFNTIECYGQECTAHIITQHFIAMRKSKMNTLKICKGHEEHFNKLGISIWFQFVKEKFPDRFNFMLEQYNNAQKQYKRAEYVIKEYAIFLEVAK